MVAFICVEKAVQATSVPEASNVTILSVTELQNGSFQVDFILSSIDGEAISGGTLYNRTTKRSTTTNFDGRGSLQCSVNDWIDASAPYFQPTSVQVTSSTSSMHISMDYDDSSY